MQPKQFFHSFYFTIFKHCLKVIKKNNSNHELGNREENLFHLVDRKANLAVNLGINSNKVCFVCFVMLYYFYYYNNDYFLFSEGTQTLAVHCRVQWQWRLHIIISQKSLRRPDRLRLLCEGNSMQIIFRNSHTVWGIFSHAL